ncbi:substrate-binding periplasmic protein [Pseudomonas indica]|uniref:Polar amino acid transport system substrate-binding protein n=1 Tax=Pseudomonas indica TaxID=137658 RepID=A0A1G9LZK4_9PSED|nr:transporter substrate-binding domain-containing protein [Pseudomonas indica]SDL67386.1 polar amino acid transport system substrate-binding protein [Pseudomonas indica]
MRFLSAMRLAACLFGLLLGSPVLAREWLAVGAQFPGVFERTTAGEYRGLAPDLLRAAMARLGDTVRFERHPWLRAQQMVEQGHADILIGPYWTAEREKRFAYGRHPFYQDRIVFYARLDAKTGWKGDLAALSDREIAVVRGWTYGERFENARPQLDLVMVGSVENGLRMLSIGRVGLLASNERNTVPVLMSLKLNTRIARLEPIIDTQRGYFAFTRNATGDALRSRFDHAFDALVADGTLARLAKKHGVETP